MAILSGETELALGTIRVKKTGFEVKEKGSRPGQFEPQLDI